VKEFNSNIPPWEKGNLKVPCVKMIFRFPGKFLELFFRSKEEKVNLPKWALQRKIGPKCLKGKKERGLLAAEFKS